MLIIFFFCLNISPPSLAAAEDKDFSMAAHLNSPLFILHLPVPTMDDWVNRYSFTSDEFATWLMTS